MKGMEKRNYCHIFLFFYSEGLSHMVRITCVLGTFRVGDDA